MPLSVDTLESGHYSFFHFTGMLYTSPLDLGLRVHCNSAIQAYFSLELNHV